MKNVQPICQIFLFDFQIQISKFSRCRSDSCFLTNKLNAHMNFDQKLGKRLAIYLGSAWVIMEAFNFFLERYHFEPLLLDILILILLTGVFNTIVFSFFKGKWNKKAIILQILVCISGLISVGYFVVNPHKLNPRVVRFASLRSDISAFGNIESLAVLPIQNNLPNQEKNYLLAGLHEGIIAEMGKLGTMKVIGRTSTLSYAKSSKSLKEIGAELNVKFILESSISMKGEEYIFRSRLLNAGDEEVVWMDEYTTIMGELPVLIDEIAEILAIEIGHDKKPNIEYSKDVDTEAFQEVLQGNYLLNKFSKSGLEEAIIHFERAIEIDSSYIEAYFGAVKVWFTLQQIGIVNPIKARQQIVKYGNKTIAIDSTHLNSFMYRGLKAFYIDYDFQKGIEYIRKCQEINPSNSEIRALMAHLQMVVGDWDNAWKEIRYAKEIDPLSPQVIGFESGLLANSGKALSAYKQSRRLAILAPESIFNKLRQLFLNRSLGRDENAIESLKLLYEEDTKNPLALAKFIDKVYAETGDVNLTWLATLKHLKSSDYQKYFPPNGARALYSFIPGYDDNLFFECLQQMAKDRHPEIPYYSMKDGNPLQDDPRYIKIMEDLGLW
jgi:TolB-like protein